MGLTRYLEDAVNKFKILRLVNIAMININYSVPIEKYSAVLFYNISKLVCIVLKRQW